MLNQINYTSFYYIITTVFLKEFFINKYSLSSIGFTISYFLLSNWLFNAYNYNIPLKIKDFPKIHEAGKKQEANIEKTVNKNKLDKNKLENKAMIKILWYNTFLLPILSTRFDIEKVIHFIHEIIKKNDVNVICLCEVWLKRDSKYLSKYLLNILGKHWKSYDSFKNKHLNDGMILFWNSDDIDIRTIYSSKYKSSSGVDSFVSKGYITTIMTPLKQLEHKKIHQHQLSQKIIFTHMQDFVGANSIQKNNAHHSQLQQLFNTITYTKYPNYIIGDLNVEFSQINRPDYDLVPSQNEYDNLKTCFNKGKYYAFDYAIKEKRNVDHSARIIYPKLNIPNPSDHNPIILTIL